MIRGMFDCDANPPSEGGTWDELLGHAPKHLYNVAFIAHEPNNGGGWANYEGSAWYIGGGGGSDRQRKLSLAVGFFPFGEGATIETAATGAYNAHYTAVAQHIEPYWPDAIIRPAWEFNGTWYPWSRSMAADQASYAAHFIAAWTHLVCAFRTVSGAFQFVFCPNGDAWGQPRPWDCFPGRTLCHAVGIDIYDQPDAGHPDAEDRFNSVTQPALDDLWWHANQLGMPVCLPEWGAGKVGD